MEIILGNGCYLIQTVNRDGKIGILFQQTCEPHDVGNKGPDLPAKYEPKKDDLIIWVENIESARVMQDQINILVLMSAGYKLEQLR